MKIASGGKTANTQRIVSKIKGNAKIGGAINEMFKVVDVSKGKTQNIVNMERAKIGGVGTPKDGNDERLRVRKEAKKNVYHSKCGNKHGKVDEGPVKELEKIEQPVEREHELLVQRRPDPRIKNIVTQRIQIPVKYGNEDFTPIVKDNSVVYIALILMVLFIVMHIVRDTLIPTLLFGVMLLYSLCKFAYAWTHSNWKEVDPGVFPCQSTLDAKSDIVVYDLLESDSWYRKIGYYGIYNAEIYVNLKNELTKKFLFSKVTSFTPLQMTRDSIELFPSDFVFDLEILRNTVSYTISEIEVYNARNVVDLRLTQATIPSLSTH